MAKQGKGTPHAVVVFAGGSSDIYYVAGPFGSEGEANEWEKALHAGGYEGLTHELTEPDVVMSELEDDFADAEDDDEDEDDEDDDEEDAEDDE